ncbi:MAG: SPOR domain-containing protein [Bacteroidetes bacterium]|jgi:hypothetical protein|nr:SPOR domain-containing protein [Bacteroidota bacterium]
MKKIFILLFSCFSFIVQAQTEIVVTDTTALLVEENVTIYKDPRLDILEKRPALMAKLELENKEKEMPIYRPIVSQDGKKTVTGSIYTQKGFRVVIYNGSERNKALEAKNNFSRAFPGVPSYMSYNVPSYKIKVGNFEDRGEASKFMRRVSAAFPSSFIVPDIVTIKNINVN